MQKKKLSGMNWKEPANQLQAKKVNKKIIYMGLGNDKRRLYYRT